MKRGVIAFAGNGPHMQRVAAAAARFGLREVASGSAFLLFAGAALADRAMPDGAHLLGDIYDHPDTDRMSAGDGWGNYLRFAGNGEALRIERAPLTGMPLYWMRSGGGILFASHLHLVADLLADLAIDWDTVAQSLSFINLRTERTALYGVAELLPGSRLDYDGHHVRIASLWSPWPHVDRRISSDIADLAPELERVLIACHHAWASSRPDILLELSGGLDSSVVAASLAGANASFSAVNFVTARGDGDERHYARAVAARCGADLIEADIGGEKVDLVASPAFLTPRPTDYAVLHGIDTAFAKAVRASDAAIFGGIGGDNIFAFDGSVAPILDAWDRFGISVRSFGALRDVARAADATLWKALGLAVGARRRGPRRGWRRETLFLAADAVPKVPFVHPWDDGVEQAVRGKRNHVEAVRRILDFGDRPGRWHDRDVVAPLLSQPVVELCLSIPSWTWVDGGRDRAVARAAFAGRLPPEVVWRRGKGRIESVAAAAYLAQRSELRTLLLDGRLASHGLVDRDAIERYLARELVPADFDYYRLLEIADVENWVRSVEASPFFGPSRAQRSY